MTYRPSCTAPRRGVALLTTLAVLVLLLLLSSGAMHLALGDAARMHEERGIAVSTAAADAGAYSLLRDWAGYDFDGMPIGDTLPTGALAAGDGWARVAGRRVSPLAWWITSTGFTPDTIVPWAARREVNLVLRQLIPELPTDATLIARDSVSVSGSGAVVGSDTSTGAWSAGCPVAPLIAGISVPDTTAVTHGVVIGSPPLRQDPAAGLASTYSAFGPATWSRLAAHAALVLPGGSVITPSPRLTSGACDTSDPANWGEPLGSGPCARYAPIVRVQGDLELSGGRGQGLLLVDGDLRVSNGAEFHGVVLTRDDLVSAPGGGRIFGLVMAFDSLGAAGNHTSIANGLLVRRSSCTVQGVLRRTAPLVAVRGRSWAELQ